MMESEVVIGVLSLFGVAAFALAFDYYSKKRLGERQRTDQKESQPEQHTPRSSGITGRHAVILGALLVIIGSFLPWVSVSTFIGTISKNGIEGDGQVTLVLGVFIILGALSGFDKPGNRAAVAGVISLLVIGLGIFEYMDITASMADLSDESGFASVGFGLYIVILGGVLGLASFVPNPTLPEAEATKACPQCAETVLAAAKVCRFCGHEFATETKT